MKAYAVIVPVVERATLAPNVVWLDVLARNGTEALEAARQEFDNCPHFSSQFTLPTNLSRALIWSSAELTQCVRTLEGIEEREGVLFHG